MFELDALRLRPHLYKQSAAGGEPKEKSAERSAEFLSWFINTCCSDGRAIM